MKWVGGGVGGAGCKQLSLATRPTSNEAIPQYTINDKQFIACLFTWHVPIKQIASNKRGKGILKDFPNNLIMHHSFFFSFFLLLTPLLHIFSRSMNSIFKSLFLPRVAEFIYIDGDNKRVCLLLQL